MDDEEIKVLRTRSKTDPVYWLNGNGGMLKVTNIPVVEMDPDNTGVSDFIATLEGGGHIDLSNAETEQFAIVNITEVFPD